MRATAAFGTLVVQKNQEDFMARAWAQFGELFEANRYRSRAQLFREVLTAMEAKHFEPVTQEKYLTVTHLAHARVIAAGETRMTLFGQMRASALPTATVQPAMRRVLRDGGPLTRRFAAAESGGVLDGVIRKWRRYGEAVSPGAGATRVAPYAGHRASGGVAESPAAAARSALG